MKILVTGGSGLVGSALKEMLKVYNCIDEYVFISSTDYDLTNNSQTMLCFERFKPDIVIHLASIVQGAITCIDTQYKSLIDNCNININVFDACSKYNVKKIITTLSVILSEKEDQVDEESIIKGPALDLNFHQGYAHSKRLLHYLSIAYQKANNGHVVLLTPVNIYGYQDIDTSNRIIPSLIKISNTSKKINFSFDSVRQLLYNNDIGKIIIQFILMDNETFIKSSLKSYIIGNPELLTIKEIIKIITDKMCISEETMQYSSQNFSRTAIISKLPFEFKYTSFNDAFKELWDNYSSKKYF
jgi:GDP-L-fucose synthase